MNERLLYTYIQQYWLKIDLIIEHCFNLTRTGGERSQIMREYDPTQSLVFSVYNNNNMKNLLRWGPVHDGTCWSWQSVTGSWNVDKMIFLGKFLKKRTYILWGLICRLLVNDHQKGHKVVNFNCDAKFNTYCLLPCKYVKLFQDIAATVKIFADWLSHSS